MFALADYNTTETVNIPFNTFTSDDPSASVTITNLAASDIEIHKDGSTTQRASDNGVTVSIDFDGITGNHMVHIDLSDNSDAGFYANGSRIAVRMEGTTVDGATINAWIGAFSIGCTLRPTTAGRTLDIQATGEVDANLTMMGGAGQSATDLKDFADAGYDPATNKVQGVVLTDTCTANTDMRGTDNAALASVLGALADAAAAGDPTEADTVMQYVKQLINVLVGSVGIPAFPAAAAPANDVSLAEVIRSTYNYALSSAAWGSINSGIVFRGTVTAADPGVSFTVGGLAGQGVGAFVDATTPWYAYVFRDAGGAGAAPQGEQKEITAYTSATGLFTTNAFSVPVAVGDNIVVMSGRIAAVPDILEDTGTTLPATLATILADTSELQADDVPGLIAALNNISSANVLTQVNAALDTAIAELSQAAPTATPSLRTGLMLLYMALRNQFIVQTSGTDALEVYNDAGTKIAKKTISDDGSDYTEAKMTSGA
jgi:hypothetical protein